LVNLLNIQKSAKNTLTTTEKQNRTPWSLELSG